MIKVKLTNVAYPWWINPDDVHALSQATDNTGEPIIGRTAVMFREPARDTMFIDEAPASLADRLTNDIEEQES